MARILVTGASGLLGASLALVAAEEHEVVGTYHQHPLELPGVKMVQADLTEAGAALRLLLVHAPDWVVHCAAATEVDRCEREPQWARQMNVAVPGVIAQACLRIGARLVHISTDAVFDGVEGEYREVDPPRPINVYGVTKLEGERNVAELDPEALILRTNFFGWSLGQKASLAEWFLHRLEQGKACPGFTDVFFSPLFADHLAGFILALLEREAHGLMHLPGRTCLSKYDFGVRLAESFNLDPTLIQAAGADDADLPAPRPRHICMVGEKAESVLGAKLPGVDAGLHDFRQLREVRQALKAAQDPVIL